MRDSLSHLVGSGDVVTATVVARPGLIVDLQAFLDILVAALANLVQLIGSTVSAKTEQRTENYSGSMFLN
ncbi:hypothetical protein [Rhodococcus erythropolis]|uniref:hypothetical protein n=1 Tax=Rhodococcus erythropolis TaxID=1833 RepID=UPI0008790B24|nr:hypothetical protein [Rhodococcus erythropolis]